MLINVVQKSISRLDRALDCLADWKTEKTQDIIKSVMDELEKAVGETPTVRIGIAAKVCRDVIDVLGDSRYSLHEELVELAHKAICSTPDKTRQGGTGA